MLIILMAAHIVNIHIIMGFYIGFYRLIHTDICDSQ